MSLEHLKLRKKPFGGLTRYWMGQRSTQQLEGEDLLRREVRHLERTRRGQAELQRFWRRRAELSVGILNLTDQDYRLNPLTSYQDMPRERVLMARFSFRF